MISNRRGQTVLEFLFSSSLILLTLTGSWFVLFAEWKRGKCAYIVFEKTHAALVGVPDPLPNTRVSIEQNEEGARGEAQCGRAHEKVHLPAIEAKAW